MGENQNQGAGQQTPPAAGAERGKTTPDEGKTFDKDTVFECVTECKSSDGVRYRRGDKLVGRKCPPHFEARPDLKPEAREDTE